MNNAAMRISEIFVITELVPGEWRATCPELSLETIGRSRDEVLRLADELLTKSTNESPELNKRLLDLISERGTPLPDGIDPFMASVLLQVPDSSADTLADDIGSELPFLLELWAPWCTPCYALAGPLSQLALERPGGLSVKKIDIQRYAEVASRLGVMSVPYLILFHKGRVIRRWSRPMPGSVVQEVTQIIGSLAHTPTATTGTGLWRP